MKLIDTIKISLTPIEEQGVLRIDNEDFRLVARKTRKQLVLEGKPHDDEYIERGLLALKQYYGVALIDPLNPHAVSDSVDPFWHAHILDTARYSRFCDEAVGYFMHHKPHDPDCPKEMDYLERSYTYTAGIYDQIYSFVDSEINPQSLGQDRLICFHMVADLAPDPSEVRFKQKLSISDVRSYLTSV